MCFCFKQHKLFELYLRWSERPFSSPCLFMCETHIHCFFLVVAASSNCIFCRFRPWDVSRSRACIFVWVYCNWWLHFLYSLVSSLKVPHWYNSCYGYSVSALRRNSAPEIALTFCYLVCRLQMIVAGVFGNCQLAPLTQNTTDSMEIIWRGKTSR